MQSTVLVTGGAGFIGRWIVKYYLENNFKVIVVDNLSTGKIDNIKEFLDDIVFFEVDIRDRSKLEEIFKRYRITLLNHHAGQSSVVVSFEDIVMDAQINITGSLNLLDLCIKNGVRKIIYASTGGAIYGDVKKMPVKETYIVNARYPYAVSKHTFEHYLFMAHRVYGIDYVVLRYGNVYGPYQNPDGEAGVVAIFIKKMLKNENVVIYGDGNQTRDFVYVEDVAKLNVVLTEYLISHSLEYKSFIDGVFNVGSQREVSVNFIFNYLSKLCGYRKSAIYDEGRGWEVRRISLDSSKIKRFINWQPETGIEEGLKKTFEWFREKLL